MTPDGLAAAIRQAAWFARLGAPPRATERADAANYLAGLGLDGVAAAWLPDLAAALMCLRGRDWSPAWMQAETAALSTVGDKANEKVGRGAAAQAINRIAVEAGPAAMRAAEAAFARAGLGDDKAGARAMAGALQAALGEAAHAVLAGADPARDPFLAKFRLFAAGRFPILAAGQHYAIL